MSRAVNHFLDLVSIPLVVVRHDFTIIDFNRAFMLLSGAAKVSVGLDVRDIGLFRDIRLDLTEALIHEHRPRNLYVYQGDSVFEVKIDLNRSQEFYGERTHFIYLIDVTRFINAEKELLRKNKELMIANSISNIFISSSETEELYGNILEKCMLVGDFGVGAVLTPAEERGGLAVRAQRGFSLAFQRSIQGDFQKLITSSESPMRVFDREEIGSNEILMREGILFFVIVPLVSSGTVLGYLLLGNRKERVFDLELASIISLIGNNVALVFDKIRLFKELERLSITDSLTGLFNRRYFYGALEKEIERVKRYGANFSLVLIDIDDFKRVNDEYGHLAGDRVLQVLADILKRTLRKVDIIARYGGEEFILLLPNTGKEEAGAIANRIREEISKTVVECRSDKGAEVICPVTISGGITTCPDDFTDADRLLSAADKAMYEAKSLGKNKMILYHKEPAIFEADELRKIEKGGSE
ncbi:MAG: sensor domain-containing diguanylate cyclase [Thermodesulfovibrionales bacterium]|nr:sensor domain-containing diguanylate cyclase [Thermodesulfovibrionales bacterium]